MSSSNSHKKVRVLTLSAKADGAATLYRLEQDTRCAYTIKTQLESLIISKISLHFSRSNFQKIS